MPSKKEEPVAPDCLLRAIRLLLPGVCRPRLDDRFVPMHFARFLSSSSLALLMSFRERVAHACTHKNPHTYWHLLRRRLSGTALYLLHSCINHSCVPSADVVFLSDDAEISLVANRDIAAGEEIEIAYIDEGLPYAERQAILARNYRFRCLCARCRRESAAASTP